MNRFLTLLGVLLAVLVVVFQLAGLITGSLVLVLAASIILIGAGILTGM
jgi:hypothetical protein